MLSVENKQRTRDAMCLFGKYGNCLLVFVMTVHFLLILDDVELREANAREIEGVIPSSSV